MVDDLSVVMLSIKEIEKTSTVYEGLIGVHRTWVGSHRAPLVIFGGGQHPNCLDTLALTPYENHRNKQRRDARR